MSDQTETEARQVRPFAAWIREQRRGAAHAELSDQLQELVTAVMELRKKGTLTLKISVSPIAKTDNAIAVVNDITLKLPQPDPEPSLFFADDDSNLVLDNPRQMKFDQLRDASQNGEKELREANGA